MTGEPKTPEDEVEAVLARLRRLDTLGPFISTTDLAGLLDWSQQTIRDNIKRGHVPAHREGDGPYQIPRAYARLWLLRALREARAAVVALSGDQHG